MRYLIILFLALMLAGCVNLERNYKPAGFSTFDQVSPYLAHTGYLAIQLTKQEWDDFYKRFPEYWQDLKAARMFGSTIKYHPAYTAYAFRWTTLNKKKPTWSAEQIQRLEKEKLVPGDTPFEIMYAIGAPERLIWDNDFEILFYQPDIALIMEAGKIKEIRTCEGCWREPRFIDEDAVPEDPLEMNKFMVLEALGLSRPTY